MKMNSTKQRKKKHQQNKRSLLSPSAQMTTSCFTNYHFFVFLMNGWLWFGCLHFSRIWVWHNAGDTSTLWMLAPLLYASRNNRPYMCCVMSGNPGRRSVPHYTNNQRLSVRRGSHLQEVRKVKLGWGIYEEKEPLRGLRRVNNAVEKEMGWEDTALSWLSSF